MTHSKEFLALEPYLKQLRHAHYLSSLLYFDLATACPDKSIESQSELVNEQDEEMAKIFSSPDFVSKVEALANLPTISKEEKRLADSLSFNIELLKKMPLEEYMKARKAFSKSNEMWRKYKETNQFSEWLPYWKDCIAYARKIDTLMMKEGMETPYDSALDMYEPGERSKDLDRIFEPIKNCIKTLLPKVLEKQSHFPKIEIKPYSIDQQRHLAYAVLNWEKYDLSKGCMRESMHPFTTDISQNDTRITTSYSFSDWRNALYSEIHEAGHALEFQNKPQEMYDNYLESVNTAAICETHSRLYENIFGRSLEFMPTLKELCAQHLDPSFKEMDVMDFYRLINYVKPITNRCDSDELTYSLHIIIRYEIERDLINGVIECEEVPAIWKTKYKDYLGVDVPNDTEGCMQDIHWTDNEIGYFPSYLLGNLYGAMIFEKMEEDIHVSSLLQENKMDEILSYLTKNDYAYDWMEPNDWIKKVTGKELTSEPFIHYLEKKYGALYD